MKIVFLVNLNKGHLVEVNGKPIQHSVQLNHRDVFSIIDRLFRLEFPTTSPQKMLNTPSSTPKDSLVSIVAVRPKSTEAIVKELNVYHPDHTRDLVKKHLGSHEDEIFATSLRASLYCPIGKMRLTTPCRARECSHIQCVDATTFLGMMKLRPKLKCPVCDRPAHFEQLYIDGLFKEILETVDVTVEEVTFSKDGSWSCKKDKEDCINIDDTLNQSVADMSIIDLTETDTEATPIKKKPLTDNTALLNKGRSQRNS